MYKKMRNKVKSTLRSCHRKLIKQVAIQARTNPKKFWAFVNSRTSYKNGIPELVISKSDNSTNFTNGPSERAEVLAEYFASVFTTENDNNDVFSLILPKTGGPIIEQIAFTSEEVFKKFINLNVGKSPGPDAIHPRVLREIAAEISELLSEIFNTSMQEGKIPNDWKLADVTALFKKGEKNLPENYRPISLTCVVCKIMERLIRDKLEEHLKCNNMLSKKQFGFIKGRSTVLQLLKVMDDWTEAIEMVKWVMKSTLFTRIFKRHLFQYHTKR